MPQNFDASRFASLSRRLRSAWRQRIDTRAQATPGTAVLLLFAGMLSVHPAETRAFNLFLPTDSIAAPAGSAEQDVDDDEDGDGDDGSRLLRPGRPFTPSDWQPIGPTEEEELLGDWGDAAGDAGD